jgi:hypothetical protein
MPAPRDDLSWHDHRRSPDREELLAPSTQIVPDREAYLGQSRHEVGRRISDDQVELFASTDVASALQLAFAQLAPPFIALHDVGTSASLHLLTSLASASGERLQRLTVRRQGHGEAMAVLQFVEVRLADDSRVRVYATDLGSDGPLRLPVAVVLLGRSQLGVLLMGGLSPTALANQLQPLNGAVMVGPWPNRELLMLPLGTGLPLANHAAQLAGTSGVAVHVTPHAGKTRQAWAYIAGAWNRLHGGSGSHALQTDFSPNVTAPRAVPSSEATTEAMGLNELPVAPVPATSAARPTLPPAGAWQSYVDRCQQLKGAVVCCAFDTRTMRTLAHTGPATTATDLAAQGTKLLRAMVEAARAVGLDAAPTDGSITAGGHQLLLRLVPGHPGIAVHLVLASNTNPTLAKLQLERIRPPQ